MRRFTSLSFVCALALVVAGCSENPERAKTTFLESGNRFYEEQKYAEAIVEYRNALQVDEKFAEARLQLARSYEKVSDQRRALQEYVRAADLLPNDDSVQLTAGRYLNDAGRFEDARTRAETVLKRNPTNVDAQILLGHATAGMKDLDTAISEIEEAIQLAPNDIRGQTSLGLLQLAKGNRETAEAAFKKAVELQPTSVDARLSLAGFYWTVNDFSAAERELKVVLTSDPANGVANRTLATLYVLSGRVAEAEPHFLKLTENAKDARSWLALSDYYTLAKRPDDATRVLERLAADPPTAAVAKTKLAMLAYERGRSADAHKLVDEVLIKQPKNATATLLKARFAMAERRLDDALKLLNETIAAEPSAAAAHYYAGTVYAQTNRPDEAAAAFTEALKLNPRITAAQLQLAQINLARGRLGDSEALARQVLSSEPADPMSRLVLVDTLFAKGDLATAERELKPLETNFPKAAAVHVRRGRLAARHGNTDSARRSFNLAFALDPTSVDALSGLVATDIAANRMSEAKARIEKQLVAAPKNARLLLLAGSIYLSVREFDKAEDVVLRAMEVDPSRLATYDILGQIYMAQGRLDEARARFEHLERQDRLATASGTVVAMILQAQNRTDEARRRYEAIVERDPKAAAAANNLAWIYAEAGGDLDRALTLAKNARQVDPEEPQIADTIGWIYYKKQLPTLAVPEFEAAIRLAPTNAVFHHHLGLAYIAAGETVKGAASLRRALSIQSNFAGAEEARQLLAQHKG